MNKQKGNKLIDELIVARLEVGVGRLGEKVKGLNIKNWHLRNSHGEDFKMAAT